jgi:hypothetical protein
MIATNVGHILKPFILRSPEKARLTSRQVDKVENQYNKSTQHVINTEID